MLSDDPADESTGILSIHVSAKAVGDNPKTKRLQVRVMRQIENQRAQTVLIPLAGANSAHIGCHTNEDMRAVRERRRLSHTGYDSILSAILSEEAFFQHLHSA